MLALDCSNYTVEFTPELLQSWKDRGVGLLIIQAFPHWYQQYEEQTRQMRMCVQEGMPFDNYLWDYLGAPQWLDGCLEGLTMLHNEHGLVARQIWLDEEDVDTEAEQTQAQRVVNINWSLIRCDAWTNAHGVQRVGIYTALWWWPPKTGNSTRFADRELWDADYDNQADTEASWTPYGGWTHRRIKQYAGSQPDGTDLNVLSVEEAEEVVPEPEPIPAPDPMPCATERNAIERAVNRLQIELDRKNSAGKPLALRRTLVKEIAGELYAALG